MLTANKSLNDLRALAKDERLRRLERSGSSQEGDLAGLLADRRLARLETVGWGSSFNVFDAMGVADHEIRHSSFLAFFFDPKESHGLGTAFYKLFCEHPDVKIELGKIPSENEVSVATELDHTDISVEDEANGITAVIENKIYALESPRQLNQYHDASERWHSGPRQHHYLFLSLQKDQRPSDPRWKPIHYNVVVDVVSHLLERDDLDKDVRFALRQYKELLISKL